jgi:hypothetical protein
VIVFTKTLVLSQEKMMAVPLLSIALVLFAITMVILFLWLAERVELNRLYPMIAFTALTFLAAAICRYFGWN